MEINTVLFKALSENELVSITKKIFGESAVLKKYELLKGGLFNTTYRIVTETSDVILRVGPVHRELLQKYEEFDDYEDGRRVELHCHTNMSAKDAVASAEDITEPPSI